MKKHKITRDNHKQLGREIQLAYRILQTAAVQLGCGYPRTEKCVKLIEAAVKSLGLVKCELDNAVCRETDSSDREVLDFYYGNSNQTEQWLAMFRAQNGGKEMPPDTRRDCELAEIEKLHAPLVDLNRQLSETIVELKHALAGDEIAGWR